MKYKEYKVEDYLSDEAFQNWVYTDKIYDFLKAHSLEDEEHKKIVFEASTILESLKPKKDILVDKKINAQWSLLVDDIQSSMNKKTSATPANSIHRSLKKISILKYAAVIGLITISVVFYFYLPNSEIKSITYQTGFGEKKNITLDDGTKVNLNSNSILKVGNYSSGIENYEIWLEGEAFFKVTKKNASNDEKLIVHAGLLDVVVLGTEFNVIHRKKNVKVALKEGVIMLEAINGVEYRMGSGEVMIYNQHVNELSKDSKQDAYYYAWLDNKLILDETSVLEITEVIKNNFGVNVSILDARLEKRTLSGVVSDNDLNVLLEAIKSSLDVQIDKDAQDIKIY